MGDRVCPDGNGHLAGREERHGREWFIGQLEMGRSDLITSLVEAASHGRGLPGYFVSWWPSMCSSATTDARACMEDMICISTSTSEKR
jgi:hypothetical protein